MGGSKSFHSLKGGVKKINPVLRGRKKVWDPQFCSPWLAWTSYGLRPVHHPPHNNDLMRNKQKLIHICCHIGWSHLLSQFSPSKPFRQMHGSASGGGWHSPPFKHIGLLPLSKQKSTARTKKITYYCEVSQLYIIMTIYFF